MSEQPQDQPDAQPAAPRVEPGSHVEPDLPPEGTGARPDADLPGDPPDDPDVPDILRQTTA